MRRRNAKKVAFADPTYYEPSENDYSTEGENEDDLDFLTVADVVHEGNLEDLQQQRMEESDVVEPLQVRGVRNGQKGGAAGEEKDSTSDSVTPQPDEAPKAHDDQSRASSDTLETTGRSHVPPANDLRSRMQMKTARKPAGRCGIPTRSTRTTASRRGRSTSRRVSCATTLPQIMLLQLPNPKR